MIESPVLQELLAERRHKDIVRVLNARFGPVPPQIATALQTIQAEDTLNEFLDWAVHCPSLEAFATRLRE